MYWSWPDEPPTAELEGHVVRQMSPVKQIDVADHAVLLPNTNCDVEEACNPLLNQSGVEVEFVSAP